MHEADGSVSFDWAVVERVCNASGLLIEQFQQAPEDAVAALLVGWYQAHRQNGGAADPAAEDLLGEVRMEDAHGQPVSHPPGRA